MTELYASSDDMYRREYIFAEKTSFALDVYLSKGFKDQHLLYDVYTAVFSFKSLQNALKYFVVMLIQSFIDRKSYWLIHLLYKTHKF